MKIIALFAAGILIILTPVSNARIIYILEDYHTIQDGINASQSGDTILVEPALYLESASITNHPVVLASMFLITGDSSQINSTIIDGANVRQGISVRNINSGNLEIIGFTIRNCRSNNGAAILSTNSSITIRDNVFINNRATVQAGAVRCDGNGVSIINNKFIANIADGNAGGIYLGGAGLIKGNLVRANRAGIYCGGVFLVGNGGIADSNTIIENSAAKAGGLYCYGNSTIINNTIENNTATSKGGGIYCQYDVQPIVSNNYISGNRAYFSGGGIYVEESSSPAIYENSISENWSESGGGINTSSNVEISNNTFSGNSAAFGGGIRCQSSAPIIKGNRFSENMAELRGAAIYCDENSNAIISANVIFENSGNSICCYFANPLIHSNIISYNYGDFCGGVYTFSSHPLIINSIIWGNEGTSGYQIVAEGDDQPNVRYCDIENGWFGDGNINLNPLYRDIANNDFHLMSTDCGDLDNSPCIDMGHPWLNDTLLECSWGLGTIRSDIGAYGGRDFTQVNIEQSESGLPNDYFLCQNYPNPFNPTTTIDYDLPYPSYVIFDVIDVMGRIIDSPIREQQTAGYHSVVWDGNRFASGIYFYRIKAGNFTLTRKMLLLK